MATKNTARKKAAAKARPKKTATKKKSPTKRRAAPKARLRRAQPIPDLPPLKDSAYRFVQEYLIDCSAKNAAIRAGYSEASASSRAYELMQDPRIQTLIEEARAKLTEDLQLERDTIARELASIGFANMRTFLEIDERGEARINLGRLTEEQFKALAEVQVEDGEGAAKGRRGKRVRIKLHDKRAALVDLAKLLGYHKEIHLHGLAQPASDTPAVPWIIQPVAPPPGAGPK